MCRNGHQTTLADITDPYATASCDAVAGLVEISLYNVNVSASENPPAGAVPLQELHSKDKSALEICNLGSHRVVSLLGIRNYDHPREDGAWVFIGGNDLLPR